MKGYYKSYLCIYEKINDIEKRHHALLLLDIKWCRIKYITENQVLTRLKMMKNEKFCIVNFFCIVFWISKCDMSCHNVFDYCQNDYKNYSIENIWSNVQTELVKVT